MLLHPCFQGLKSERVPRNFPSSFQYVLVSSILLGVQSGHGIQKIRNPGRRYGWVGQLGPLAQLIKGGGRGT